MNPRGRDWIAEPGRGPLRLLDARLAAHYLADEAGTVRALRERARLPAADTAAIVDDARGLVTAMRANREAGSSLDAFMSEYDLSSREGVVLMCLAEALLRIPDAETADRLIADKLGTADFHEHLGTSESLLVNIATWGLMLTGRLVREELPASRGFGHVLHDMLSRLGEPVVRQAVRQAMRVMSHQFVMGRTIEDAMRRAADAAGPPYRYSFDMLGEAALTAADADDYLAAYAHAIAALGDMAATAKDAAAAPGISVKLSALSPRFELAQRERAVPELTARLGTLATAAAGAGVGLTIDAEESERLDVTLEIFAAVYGRQSAPEGPGIGLAVQAYQKRAASVIDWLASLAQKQGRQIPVRLVKGAYWDTEIKLAQQRGLAGYPVFTRKSSTDVSYLACARRLLEAAPHLYPQFATHNAHTAAWLMQVGKGRDFEFQRLHGMGQDLYAEIVGPEKRNRPCRVYAPVGRHEDLLPYLVRRLLENGANTSFVNRFVQAEWAVDALVEDPVAASEAQDDALPHPRIPLPRRLYGDARRNSSGVNLSDPAELGPLAAAMQTAAAQEHRAGPVVAGERRRGEAAAARDPCDAGRIVGTIELADAATAKAALDAASTFFPHWNATPAGERAQALERAAGALENDRAELVMLIVGEGGRTVADALAELREAVDFLRFYAAEARRLFGPATVLAGPTGESNTLRQTGRGAFVCISPWNFPVAIFTGQIAAALAAGNTVIAKPAEATSLVAGRVTELLHAAGIPPGALQFLPGSGAGLGAALLPDARVAGVAFTGSLETAKTIERTLAARDGAIAALIAETGGVNAMIVDSSALTEQVVKDAVHSAFDSAGQRCSALRLLCLQSDTADEVIAMLEGRMAELVIGDPAKLSTDIGPVINAQARTMLERYCEANAGRMLYRCQLGPEHAGGHFVAPALIELADVRDLTREIFGPVLHVLRYEADALDALVDGLNDVGYGLTLGVHSRIGSFAQRIIERARVGNIYVNRDMIGAVVGVQPFGGLGLSGTGPKAGGPNYLARFGVEQSVSVNTAAVGGNTELLSLDELADSPGWREGP